MLPIRELPQSEGESFDSVFLDSTLKKLLNLATKDYNLISFYRSLFNAIGQYHKNIINVSFGSIEFLPWFVKNSIEKGYN